MGAPDKEVKVGPVSVGLKVQCDRAGCEHRSGAGWCYVGDPQWSYLHSANRIMVMLCSSYEKGG